MSLFNTPEDKEMQPFGSFFNSQRKVKSVSTESKVNPEIQKKNGEVLKKAESAKSTFESERITKNCGPVLPGMKTPSTIRNEEVRFATKEAIESYTMEAKSAFTEALTDKLFVEKIASVVVESCPIDDEIKGRHDIKKFIFEMSLDMYKDLKKIKDFKKASMENKFPSFVGELYELCNDTAAAEAEIRFNQKSVFESCGLEIQKVNDFIGHELENVCVLTESSQDYFNSVSSYIMVENEDVVQTIKDKVTGELDNYKESAKKIAEIKSAVSDSEKPDEPVADSEPTTPDTGSEETPPAEGEEKPEEDAVPEGEDKPAEGDAEPKPEGEEKPDEAAPATSEAVTAELDDAASFAESKSHTFNTGDEKFEMLRTKYAAQVIDAVNRGDLEKLNELKNTTAAAVTRLQAISDAAGGKYSNSVKKLQELSGSVAFELNKKIEKTSQDTRENYSVLESFILKIGQRHYKSISLEGGNISDLPKELIVNESLVYYTALEAFNTLKLMDLNEPKEYKAFEDFMHAFRG